ncbi:hypothetical protein [Anabaena sp. UHCC 0399]|uniref:hypothetical protein n=1 Tax=Anabaena sp. UHCC 0399 TaxID=3110238 RepID=UPI002B211A67|nr:hypothetical protein [Anabaena sp. UHCC 0399]MEA5569280.1 hypothetical protein [Anabaena sp. UHCC 0399]
MARQPVLYTLLSTLLNALLTQLSTQYGSDKIICQNNNAGRDVALQCLYRLTQV